MPTVREPGLGSSLAGVTLWAGPGRWVSEQPWQVLALSQSVMRPRQGCQLTQGPPFVFWGMIICNWERRLLKTLS